MPDQSPLSPDPNVLAAAWREQVEAEYEQVERLREWHEADYYAPVAHHFAVDPHRSDDRMLEQLKAISRPDATWLDIGAGGGRYALPLALASARVIAIEPSEGMRKVLSSGMEQHGIDNIDILDLRWPDGADGLAADFSLAAHVGYDIRDIGGFLDAMERSTRELCCALMMDRAPSGGYVHVWEAIHGEHRYQLPGMREFVTLLLARGATPEIRLGERQNHAMTEEDIRSGARRRLWLAEGSEKDQRLQAMLDTLLAQSTDDFQLPSVVALVTWEPVR